MAEGHFDKAFALEKDGVFVVDGTVGFGIVPSNISAITLGYIPMREGVVERAVDTAVGDASLLFGIGWYCKRSMDGCNIAQMSYRIK